MLNKTPCCPSPLHGRQGIHLPSSPPPDILDRLCWMVASCTSSVSQWHLPLSHVAGWGRAVGVNMVVCGEEVSQWEEGDIACPLQHLILCMPCACWGRLRLPLCSHLPACSMAFCLPSHTCLHLYSSLLSQHNAWRLDTLPCTAGWIFERRLSVIYPWKEGLLGSHSNTSISASLCFAVPSEKKSSSHYILPIPSNILYA